MKDRVIVLHGLRLKQREYANTIAESKAAWEQDNAFTLNTKNDIDAAIAETEAELKAQRVELFNELGGKGKLFGIGIREVTKLDYDRITAYLWAIDHTICLSLDTRSFEKLAKVDTPDFVTITTEPQATIAADLSIYLEGD